MKRLFWTLCLLLAIASASAQSWSDKLKEMASSAATEAIDQLTDGKLTEAAIKGSWNYTRPALRLESSDVLSSLSGSTFESTITSRMEKAFSFVGIKEGSASFTFNEDKTFKAVLGKKTLEGSYTFDASTHTITLDFSSKLLSTMSGRAYIDGKELQLLFPVTKLVELIKSVGNSISYLQSVAKVLENYDEVYLGFGFSKQE